MDIPKLFGREDVPNPLDVQDIIQRGLEFKQQMRVAETVEVNQNFYVGRQWEGIRADGLPKPVFNTIKRIVGHTVASTTSDNIHVQANQLQAVAEKNGSLYEPTQISNDIFESITERCNLVYQLRQFVRDAAINGDGCLHVYWDNNLPTIDDDVVGDIQVESVENTRVFFGDPQVRDPQEQPYIIIEKRERIRDVMLRCKANGHGKKTIEDITPDTDRRYNGSPASRWHRDDKVNVYRVYYKNTDTGTIWGYECTERAEVKEPTDLGIKLYPIVWMSWDRVRDSYHGQALVTGIIPNQIFINRAWAMTLLSISRQGTGKVVYDATRIDKWTNAVGAAIPVKGGDVKSAVMNIDPPAINPQIAQLIQLAVDMTETMLGHTKASTGEAAAYNTSALVTQQRAAQAPHEITKQDIYKSIEDLYRIFLEFMGEYYGVRTTNSPPTKEMTAMYQMAMMPIPDTVPLPFDFSFFKNHPCKIKLDVGASSYYSEIQSIETLTNLFQMGGINILQLLKRLPDGSVQDRRGLIRELEQTFQQMMGQNPAMPSDGSMPTQQMMDMAGGNGGGNPSPTKNPDGGVTGNADATKNQEQENAMPVSGGKGNGGLQRAINQNGTNNK